MRPEPNFARPGERLGWRPANGDEMSGMSADPDPDSSTKIDAPTP